MIIKIDGDTKAKELIEWLANLIRNSSLAGGCLIARREKDADGRVKLEKLLVGATWPEGKVDLKSLPWKSNPILIDLGGLDALEALAPGLTTFLDPIATVTVRGG